MAAAATVMVSFVVVFAPRESVAVTVNVSVPVAVGAPLYVVALDPAQNRVVVGEDRDLFRNRFLVREVNWIRPLAPGDTVEAQVKIRHNHPGAVARVEALANSQARVDFIEPQRAITPGQAAVFYDGDEVLGGGWISPAP